MSSPDPRSPSDSRALAHALLLDDTAGKGPAGHWRHCFPEIIGRSEPMLKVLETVSKVARSDVTVLVLGESGTGKELIASAIHRLSPRAANKYVAINSSAIPEQLLESELFGHEKGAFTGAHVRSVGKFQHAHGGTIFLDEIGDMPQTLQAKLLRVLNDKKFTSLGSNQIQDVDVRIIAATNMDLDQAVESRTFRLDLFYRLNVMPIHLPALRERRSDIPHLLEHFILIANRKYQSTEFSYLSDGLVRHLSAYSWPGNIRQLENLIERLVVMRGGGMIDIHDLPVEIRASSGELSFAAKASSSSDARSAAAGVPILTDKNHQAAPAPLPTGPLSPGRGPVIYPQTFGALPAEGLDLAGYIESLENELIRQALERTGNNRNQAAKLLGLNRTTLVERIKKRRLTVLNEPSKEL